MTTNATTQKLIASGSKLAELQQKLAARGRAEVERGQGIVKDGQDSQELGQHGLKDSLDLRQQGQQQQQVSLGDVVKAEIFQKKGTDKLGAGQDKVLKSQLGQLDALDDI